MLTFVFGFLAELRRETGSWLDRILPLPRLRRPFRAWRRSRPLWPGVLTAVAGIVLIAPPMAPLPLMLRVGIGAMSGVGIGAVLVAGGICFVVAPSQRLFASVVTAIASITSLATSNLGGLGVGCGLGLLGSSLAFGWTPDPVRTEGAGPVRTEAHHETSAPESEVPEVEAPKVRRGSAPRGVTALSLGMPLVLAAALTAALPPHTASAAERCDRPTWPFTDVPLPGTSCEGGSGGGSSGSNGGSGSGGSGDVRLPHPGKGLPDPGRDKGEKPGKDASDSGDSTDPGDPRQGPARWQVPCAAGADTGGRDNPPTGEPPSRGGEPQDPEVAKRGEINDDDDYSPRRPPLVVGDQPGPGRAGYPVSPRYPEVRSDRLTAYNAVIHGSTYLRKKGGGRIKVLWVHADRLVAKNYHLEVRGPDGTKHRLDTQLDIPNVDVYATYLNGSVEIPKLNVNTPKICVGADAIPANLPVAVQLPALTMDPVRAGQVLVDADRVGFSGMRTDHGKTR
ncbi:DUF6114 domain-containing protein [Streptomyces sp. ODS28]|uniref:DUF6114 domain-containing protein n=1 Tax=Streptomyces sp. ODS28 TaxID=3136688 RepID=UPI0031EDA91A